MNYSRRSVLRKASALSALAVGASATASAADCSGTPAWDATTLYETGDRVQHSDGDGVDALWEAALDSRNAEPSRSSSYWDYVGDCDGSGGNAAPTASFTTSMSTPAPGESVTFDASGSSDSDGSISSYSWDFGDGSTGSGQTVSHSYSSSGDYTVTLTVTDTDGATDSASQTVSVSSEDSNSAPNASFTVSPSSPTTGESATFDAADSSDSDGSISSYEWEFGDGSSASGQTASHTYGSTGEYTATLTVTDDDGATDTNSTTVTVQSDDGSGANCDGVSQWDPDTAYNGGDQVLHDGQLWTAEWWTQGTEPAESENVWTLEGSCGNLGPDAVASASPTTPSAGETVTFDGSGSADPDGSISAYEWEFGDGATASGETVTHAYDADGSYTATLTVTDDAGATGTDSVTISVGDSGGGGGGSANDVFAPYQGTWGSVVDGTLNVETDRVVLSFVGDGTSGDGVNPGWLTDGGQRPLGDFADEIQTLQDNGVDVWVAMGGWHGRTIAADATSATEVKEAYEQVIDTLGVTHIDIDDENAQAAHRDGTVYQLRNEGLAMLQAERPEIEISYTVPAGSGGVENRNYAPAKDMISDAVAQGVELSYVNIMTMGHGGDYTAYIPGAAQGTVDWLANVYPDKSEAERWAMLGVTPNVGESNFDTSDGQWLVDYAEQNDVGLLSFWALYKDSAASQADVFYGFEDDED